MIAKQLPQSLVHFIHHRRERINIHTHTHEHASFHCYVGQWGKQRSSPEVDTLKTLFTNRFDYIVHNVYAVVHILTYANTCRTYTNIHTNHTSGAIILTSWWNERAEWSVYASNELSELNAITDYFLIYISNTQFLYLTTHIYSHALIPLLFSLCVFSCASRFQTRHTGFTKHVGVYQIASKFSRFSVNVEFLLWDKAAFRRTDWLIWGAVNSAYIAFV